MFNTPEIIRPAFFPGNFRHPRPGVFHRAPRDKRSLVAGQENRMSKPRLHSHQARGPAKDLRVCGHSSSGEPAAENLQVRFGGRIRFRRQAGGAAILAGQAGGQAGREVLH